MNNLYFESVAGGINIVALTDTSNLIKGLELSYEYQLINEQRQVAFEVIDRVKNNSGATLLDVFNALPPVPILEQFALNIKKCFLPN